MECEACNKRPLCPSKQAALCTSKQPANNGTRRGNKGPDKALSLPQLQLWRRAVSACDNVVVTAFASLAHPTQNEVVEPAGHWPHCVIGCVYIAVFLFYSWLLLYGVFENGEFLEAIFVWKLLRLCFSVDDPNAYHLQCCRPCFCLETPGWYFSVDGPKCRLLKTNI